MPATSNDLKANVTADGVLNDFTLKSSSLTSHIIQPESTSPAGRTQAQSSSSASTNSSNLSEHDTSTAKLSPSVVTSSLSANNDRPSAPNFVETPTDTPSDPTTTDVIDMETFTQIIDLDDDGTHDFAQGMADAYFLQAEDTFTKMDAALSQKDLGQLSSLGHFLKGSSAALGVTKVQASCENIQHYGQRRDEATGTDLTEEVALNMIRLRITEAKRDYADAEKWLKEWFDLAAAETVTGE